MENVRFTKQLIFNELQFMRKQSTESKKLAFVLSLIIYKLEDQFNGIQKLVRIS